MRSPGHALALLLVATPLMGQTISRTPQSQPRAVAIHREPKPEAAPARPAQPVIVVDGYHPGWLANYGGYPLPYAVPAYATMSPPLPPPEVAGPAPAPAMAWVPGYYTWNGAGFNWQQGRWVAIPAGYTRWVSGRWEQNQHGFFYVQGYWAY